MSENVNPELGSSTGTNVDKKFGRTVLNDELIMINTPIEITTSNFYENEKNRGTKFVDMDECDDIVVESGEEKRIATYGLGGCTAVAISAELPDGSRKGYVQHYSPINSRLSASMLTEAASSFTSDGATNVRVVVMTPGEWTQNPSTEKLSWSMVPKDYLLTTLLTKTAQNKLGLEADVQIYPYSEIKAIGRYGQGTLMIEFKADGTVNILAEAKPVKPLGE